MEKRSRRRIRDLVTQSASQGLSQNKIGCARISMMAKSTNALFTGRIQKRKTNPLHHSHLACNTRPVHTDGSFSEVGARLRDVSFSIKSGKRSSTGSYGADRRPGRSGTALLFLFVIFFVFLQLGFFVDKQFLDLLTLRRVASDFDQIPYSVQCLLYDKTLHHGLRLGF
jgi:hypothetical protein